ncbi:MAG: hypothetical protein LBR20_08040 [Propionibacteriaceae bacterium]|jgi:hypothetical protein|nr:hypothetical protein [Propionibacteriaceae bacterium]
MPFAATCAAIAMALTASFLSPTNSGAVAPPFYLSPSYITMTGTNSYSISLLGSATNCTAPRAGVPSWMSYSISGSTLIVKAKTPSNTSREATVSVQRVCSNTVYTAYLEVDYLGNAKYRPSSLTISASDDVFQSSGGSVVVTIATPSATYGDFTYSAAGSIGLTVDTECYVAGRDCLRLTAKPNTKQVTLESYFTVKSSGQSRLLEFSQNAAKAQPSSLEVTPETISFGPSGGTQIIKIATPAAEYGKYYYQTNSTTFPSGALTVDKTCSVVGYDCMRVVAKANTSDNVYAASLVYVYGDMVRSVSVKQQTKKIVKSSLEVDTLLAFPQKGGEQYLKVTTTSSEYGKFTYEMVSGADQFSVDTECFIPGYDCVRVTTLGPSTSYAQYGYMRIIDSKTGKEWDSGVYRAGDPDPAIDYWIFANTGFDYLKEANSSVVVTVETNAPYWDYSYGTEYVDEDISLQRIEGTNTLRITALHNVSTPATYSYRLAACTVPPKKGYWPDVIGECSGISKVFTITQGATSNILQVSPAQVIFEANASDTEIIKILPPNGYQLKSVGFSYNSNTDGQWLKDGGPTDSNCPTGYSCRSIKAASQNEKSTPKKGKIIVTVCDIRRCATTLKAEIEAIQKGKPATGEPTFSISPQSATASLLQWGSTGITSPMIFYVTNTTGHGYTAEANCSSYTWCKNATIYQTGDYISLTLQSHSYCKEGKNYSDVKLTAKTNNGKSSTATIGIEWRC